mgnify:CR=1 FL=1
MNLYSLFLKNFNKKKKLVFNYEEVTYSSFKREIEIFSSALNCVNADKEINNKKGTSLTIKVIIMINVSFPSVISFWGNCHPDISGDINLIIKPLGWNKNKRPIAIEAWGMVRTGSKRLLIILKNFCL